MALENEHIAFLGGGRMASALAGGLLASGVEASRIAVAEPDPERRELVARELGVTTVDDNARAVRGADVVVIAVKPGVVPEALSGGNSHRQSSLSP